MTLREFLLRKRRFTAIAQWTPIVVLLGLLLVVGPRKASVPLSEQLIFACSIMIPYALWFGFTAQWPSCPHCGFNLFEFELRKRKQKHINFCPHCARPLDERLAESVPRGWP